MDEQRKCLAVIRVRGISDIFREINETLDMLHLRRNYHATLIDSRSSYLGMLEKAQNYVTWGEVSKKNITYLLKTRGKLVGNKKLTDQYAQEIGYKSLGDLSEAIFQTKIEYIHLPKIKPVFRLHPPSKGFKGKVKRSYSAGGVSGYRGEAINTLLEKMI